MQHITSVQNQRIKRALKLHTSRGRQKQGRIVIFGQREIDRAIRSGIEPDELFVDASEPLTETIEQWVEDFDSKSFGVTEDVFAKISFGSRREGAVMTAVRPDQSFDGLLRKAAGRPPLVAVVEGIEKPGNLGAIMRTADGAGIDALIVSDAVTDWFHPNCIRASVGTCFGLPGCSGTSEEVQSWLSEQGFEVLLAALPESESLFEASVDSQRATAIVLGTEATGLSPAWTGKDYRRLSLPMRGIADSLNVSAAAAVFLYELASQKGRV